MDQPGANSENRVFVLKNFSGVEFTGGDPANEIRCKINFRIWPTGF